MAVFVYNTFPIATAVSHMRYKFPSTGGGDRVAVGRVYFQILYIFPDTPLVALRHSPDGGELIMMICFKELLQHLSNCDGGVAHAV